MRLGDEPVLFKLHIDVLTHCSIGQVTCRVERNHFLCVFESFHESTSTIYWRACRMDGRLSRLNRGGMRVESASGKNFHSTHHHVIFTRIRHTKLIQSFQPSVQSNRLSAKNQALVTV